MTIHCLLIEDDVFTQNVFALTLQRAKFKVDTVPNGEKAIQYLNDNKPDIVVVDLHLPYISGYQVIRHLRETPHLADVKIIAVTANNLAENSEEAQLADAFIVKPVDIRALAKMVESLVLPQEQ